MILHEEQLPRFIIWEISVPTVGSRAIAQTTGVRIALLFRTKKKIVSIICRFAFAGFKVDAMVGCYQNDSSPWGFLSTINTGFK